MFWQSVGSVRGWSLLGMVGLVCSCAPEDSGAPEDPPEESVGDSGTEPVEEGNTAPTAATVSLGPVGATTLDDLVITVVEEAWDADGDELELEVRWLRDGETMGYTDLVLPASATARDETWTAVVQASDGQALGPEARAELTVVNTAPAAPQLIVLPEGPTTDEDLVCVVAEPAVDVDGDALAHSVSWWRNGEVFPDTVTTLLADDTVPASATSGGQRWQCVVTVDDGSASPVEAEAWTSIERELTRGYRVLSEWGLSLQAWDNFMGAYTDAATWEASNLTTPWGTQNIDAFPDQPFGLIGSGSDLPSEIAEIYAPYVDRLTTIQLGDEDYFSEEWLEENGNFIRESWLYLPSAVVHTNHWIGQIYGEEMERWVQEGRPDLLTWDTYHFYGSSYPGMGEPFMLSNLQLYRQFALAGYDGEGNQPIPFGQYAQAFETTPGYSLSESELRLYAFGTWTFGGRWLNLFAWNSWWVGGASSYILFDTFPNSDPTPSFYEYADAMGESRHLSPALSALFSTDVVIVPGSHSCDGGTCQNDLPEDAPYFLTAVVPPWDPETHPWIVGVEVENLGAHNDGLPGDIVIGSFEPLLESCDGPDVHGEPAWMILNSFIAPNEGDRYHKTGGSEELVQRVTLTFRLPEAEAGQDPVSQALRVRRDDGEVEALPMFDLGDGTATLQLELPGGTADLIKLDTGAVFCGAQDPP